MSTEQAVESPFGRNDLGSLRSIAVFRALQLGDLLCAVPALRALRAAAPRARITLIGLPWASSFVERYSKYIDEHMVFPGFPGLPEIAPQLEKIPAFLVEAQQRRFDLAIQLHGSGSLVNPLVAAMGARRNAGFCTPEDYRPDPDLFINWIDTEHEVLRYLRLMKHLGIPSQGGALEFPLTARDYQSLELADVELPAPGSYVCIHPGARLKSRRWQPQRFAQVADGLAALGLRIVLTGSPDERDVIDAVKVAMGSHVLDMCGKTDLGALAVLVARARMVICNDTGMSHVAAAVATPSVVICSGADPRRWAPLDSNLHRVLHADMPCRPCAHAECPMGGHPCADSVSAGQVLAESLNLLDGKWKSPAKLSGSLCIGQGALASYPAQVNDIRSLSA